MCVVLIKLRGRGLAVRLTTACFQGWVPLLQSPLIIKHTFITSRGSERRLGKLRLIVFIFITSTETDVTVVFVLRIWLTIPIRWRMKSMCCFTARNMIPADRNILIYWVLRISDFDNQESIAKLLWKIRMIRINLGAECWLVLELFETLLCDPCPHFFC